MEKTYTEELLEAASTLHAARVAQVATKEALDLLLDTPAIREASQAQVQATVALHEADRAFRELALRVHSEKGWSKMVGVEIVNIKKLRVIDRPGLNSWCKANLPALMVVDENALFQMLKGSECNLPGLDQYAEIAAEPTTRVSSNLADQLEKVFRLQAIDGEQA